MGNGNNGLTTESTEDTENGGNQGINGGGTRMNTDEHGTKKGGGEEMVQKRLSFTLAELIVLLFVAAILALLVLTIATRHDRQTCRRNLGNIAKVMYAYSQNNSDFFPFSNGPFGCAPGSLNNAAATSLGCLHPQYIADASLFRCPTTMDEPAFLCAPGSPSACTSYEWSSRKYTLVGSSYGYDPRIFPAAVTNLAIAGDMDGSYAVNPKTKTQNHASGQTVLFLDGHVEWSGTNYASNEPTDNIFCEDAWSADTDAYLVRGDLNDLKASFDDYGHLK